MPYHLICMTVIFGWLLPPPPHRQSRKRRTSEAEERGTDARAKAKGRGGCSDSLGPTGLSDEELEEGDGSSDASGSGCDTDGSDLEDSDDMMDEVTEAMLFAERVADEAEEDSAGSENESGFGGRAGEIREGSDPGVGSGCKLREDGRRCRREGGGGGCGYLFVPTSLCRDVVHLSSPNRRRWMALEL